MSSKTRKEKKIYCKKGTRRNHKTGLCEEKPQREPTSLEQLKEAAFSFHPLEISEPILPEQRPIEPALVPKKRKMVLECSKNYVLQDSDLPRKAELENLTGSELRKIHAGLINDPSVLGRTPGVKTKDLLIALVICLENEKKRKAEVANVTNVVSGTSMFADSLSLKPLQIEPLQIDPLQTRQGPVAELPKKRVKMVIREPLSEPDLDEETKIDLGSIQTEEDTEDVSEDMEEEEPESLAQIVEINEKDKELMDKIGVALAANEEGENTFLFEKEKIERENLESGALDFLYPDLNDPNFNIKIAQRKEFNETQYDGTIYDIKEQADKLCNVDFELMPHQLFVKNFMSIQTPYNALLLFHSLGSGKTCTSIGIAEETRAYMKQIGLNQPIIIVASPNVQQNFRLQLFDERKLKLVNGRWTSDTCVGNALLQEINPTNLSGIPKDRIVSEVNTIINRYYSFMGYTELANYIRRHSEIPKASRFSMEEQKQLRIRKIHKYFDNRLVIVDEAHNIRISEDNREEAKTATLLMEVARYANNMRLVLLSATPMYNSYKEIIWLTNLLNAVDKRASISESDVFNKEGEFLPERTTKDGKKLEGGRELLRRKLTGYVSYVRGENPYTFPYRIYPETYSPENALVSIDRYPTQQLNGRTIEEPLKHTPVYLSPMGEYQRVAYAFIMNHLRNKTFIMTNKFGQVRELPSFENMDSFGYILLMQPLEALNITFPYPNLAELTGSAEGYGSEGKGEAEPYPEERNEEIIKNIVGKRGLYRIMSRKEEKGTIPNIYDFEYKSEYKENRMFHPDNIGKYSGKIARICESIRNSVGIVLIYTQYIEGGIVPVALALEEMGFGRFSIASHVKSLFKDAPTEPLDALTMKPRSQLPPDTPFQHAKYIMITGNKAFSPDNLADIKYATAPNNKNGERVKVILISKAGSEGLDFKYIRQIHILEPWYNMSRIEQIIGRGVRNLSHCGLEFEKRNVEIYLHSTLPSDSYDSKAGVEEEPADLYVYRFAEKKAEQIGQVTRLLKENAADCILNVGQSNFTIEKLTSLVQNRDINIQLSSKAGEEVPFQIGDRPYTQICDYMDNCAFTCDPNVGPIEESDIIQNTYNNDLLKMNYNGIVKRIRDLFRERVYYSRDELISSINVIKKYPTSHIDYALTRFVENKTEYVYDRWGRTGYLINRGEYYAFQPIEITDESISLFERGLPVDRKREYVEIELPKEKGALLTEEEPVAGEPSALTLVDEKTLTDQYNAIIDELNKSVEKVKEWRMVREQNSKKVPTGESDWYMNAGYIFSTIVENHGIPENDLFEFTVYHFLDTLPTNDRIVLIKYLYSLDNENIEPGYEKELRTYFDSKIVEVRGKKCAVLVSDKLAETSDEQFKIYMRENELTWNAAEPTDRIAALKAIIPLSLVPPNNMSRMVGFMQVFRNNDVVFKTMDLQNKLKKGSRCGGEGKKDIMKKLNIILGEDFKYTEENTEDTDAGKNLIVKPGMCIILEMLLRFFNKTKRGGKTWFLDLERSTLNKLVK